MEETKYVITFSGNLVTTYPARVEEDYDKILIYVGDSIVFAMYSNAAYFYPEELPEGIRVVLTSEGKRIVEDGVR